MLTTKVPTRPWTSGASVVVVPRPLKLPFGLGVIPVGPEGSVAAAQIADGLRRVGAVRVQELPPGAIPPGAATDDAAVCTQARELGVRYVVEVVVDMDIEREVECLLGDGVLRMETVSTRVPIVDNVVWLKDGDPDGDGGGKCLIQNYRGWSWSKRVEAKVRDTLSCSLTGGTFAVADKGKAKAEPASGIESLKDKIDASVGDLFPHQAVVVKLDGKRGVVAEATGMREGDIYQVYRERPGSIAPETMWAYTKRVEDERAYVEPFNTSQTLEPGDTLVSRGKLWWLDLSLHTTVGLLSAGDDHAVTHGAGGRSLVAIGNLVLGLQGEALKVHNETSDGRVDSSGVLNMGFSAGYNRHILPRTDVYGLVSLGFSATASELDDSDGAEAFYLSPVVGARLTLDWWFVRLEAGAVITTVYSGWESDHADMW